MLIRQMGEQDLDAVSELEKQSFSDPWTRESMEREYQSEDNIYLTAEIDGKVAGYCCVWCSFESADLCNIATAPEYRKQGIASALLQEAIRLCTQNQVQKLFLEVRTSNTPAIHLYRKFNFKMISIRKNYYKIPVEDAWVMLYEIEQLQ